MIDDTKRSYTGDWARAVAGVGGATVVVNEVSQAFVHYIYDDRGRPVWLIGPAITQAPTVREMELLQFSGYCAVCSEAEVSNETAGMFTRDFVSEDSMTWSLDYVLNAPLSGSVNREDDVTKLTLPLACP